LTDAEKPTTEALRAALREASAAHNRAVLAGVTVALAVAVASLAVALGLAFFGSPLPAIPLVAFAGLLVFKGLKLHRRVIRALGAGREAAVEVARHLSAAGGSAALKDLEAAFPRDVLLAGLDLLDRLDLVRGEAGPGGEAGREGEKPERVRLDRDRLDAFIAHAREA